MTIKDMIKKQKGKWKIKYTDNYIIVIDLDNMLWDSYRWYRATGTLEAEITNIDELLKNIISYERI